MNIVPVRVSGFLLVLYVSIPDTISNRLLLVLFFYIKDFIVQYTHFGISAIMIFVWYRTVLTSTDMYCSALEEKNKFKTSPVLADTDRYLSQNKFRGVGYRIWIISVRTDRYDREFLFLFERIGRGFITLFPTTLKPTTNAPGPQLHPPQMLLAHNINDNELGLAG